MKLYFDDLVRNVVRERVAGKSFDDIAQRYFLRDAEHAQLIYEWKTGVEPTEWKQQLLDIEYMRLERIHEAFWPDAMAGDPNAAKIVLQTSNLKKSYVEQRPYLDTSRAKEIEKLLIDQKNHMQELGKELKDQISKMNEVLKDFDFSDL